MPDIIFAHEGMEIAGILFRWYGVVMVLAAFVGIDTASRLAKQRGLNPEHAWRAMLWVIPLGLIGARLWFVMFPPDSMVAIGRTNAWMLSQFFDLNQGAVAVWSGGLGLIGGVCGGLLGMAIYARRNAQTGETWLIWLDVAAIGLALAICIGRWANGANQELYGPPNAWGILIDDVAQRVAPYTDLVRYPLATTYFHPLWLYESLWAGVVVVILLVKFRRNAPRIALWFVLLYGGGRFVLEFWRVNVSHIAGINVSQVVIAAIVALAAAFLWQMRA